MATGRIDYAEDPKADDDGDSPPVEGLGLRLLQLGLVKKKSDVKLLFRVVLKLVVALTIMWAGLVVSTTLYYGALWDPNTYSLDVGIANRDRGVLTPSGTIINFGGIVSNGLVTARTEDDDEQFFHWRILEDDEDDDYIENVRYKNDWATLLFPANYSAVIWQTLRAGRRLPYDNPVIVTYNQGRQSTTADIVVNTLRRILNGISNRLGKSILNGAFGPVDTMNTNPDVFVDPVYMHVDTLYEVDNNGANFSSYMGIIVIWIQSILGVNIVLNSTELLMGAAGLPRVSTIRVFLLAFVCILISLSVALIGIIFGLRPEKSFGALWGYLLLCVITFQSIILFLVRGLGPIGLMLLTTILILQVTTSDALLHVEMMPDFYGVVGIVLPFHHAVEGLRYVTFGGPCCLDIGINILVLCLYTLGFWALTLVLWKIKFKRFVNRASKGMLPYNDQGAIDSSVGYGV